MLKTSNNLTPAVFYILLALLRESLHGYGIMKQVELDSGGAEKMGPGTLYGSLDRMLKHRFIAEANIVDRRKYYKITALGRKILITELERFEAALRAAKSLRLT